MLHICGTTYEELSHCLNVTCAVTVSIYSSRTVWTVTVSHPCATELCDTQRCSTRCLVVNVWLFMELIGNKKNLEYQQS